MYKKKRRKVKKRFLPSTIRTMNGSVLSERGRVWHEKRGTQMSFMCGIIGMLVPTMLVRHWQLDRSGFNTPIVL